MHFCVLWKHFCVFPIHFYVFKYICLLGPFIRYQRETISKATYSKWFLVNRRLHKNVESHQIFLWYALNIDPIFAPNPVSSWDVNVPSPGPPKLWLLINSHQTSATEAPNMASMANRAYRPWGGPYTCICAVIVAADALHWWYDHHNQQTSDTMVCPHVVP